MTEIIEKKYKHLTLSERIDIESGLNNNHSIRQIAREIGKSPSTLVYEISNRKIKSKANRFNGSSSDYNCERLSKPSSVCNGCPSKIGCRKTKYYYKAKDSQADYKNLLVSSREGIDFECEDFITLNKIVKEDIEKGHSFYMIVQNNKEINVTERTLYNYQENGYLDSKNIDLPRKVRYKKRKRTVSKTKKDRTIRIGRTYDDFKKYISDNSISHFVQLDTVEGKKGGECLLTMAFINEDLLLSYKIKEQSVEEVRRVFTSIKKKIGYDNFYRYFHPILTDNGSEFSDISHIEKNGETTKETKVFFCDPRHSEQKGSLEVTHEYIRRYIPKGTDISNYSDENIKDMIDNINSANREQHDGKSAYEILEKRIPKNILDKLGLTKINSKDVILNNRLFKK
jgi:IS30 family transposase